MCSLDCPARDTCILTSHHNTDCFQQRGQGWYVNGGDALDHYNRGLAWTREGDHGRAIPDYERAGELDPTDVDAFLNLGNCWYAKEDYDRAIEFYDVCVELNPKYFRAYSAAKADFTLAIELCPGVAVLYSNRGQLWIDLGEYEKGVADFSKALEIDPTNWRFYYGRGISFDAVDDYAKAIADYDEAIDYGCEIARVYLYRGNAYFETGDYDRAIANYGQGIRRTPNDVALFLRRGHAYLGVDKPEVAILDYERAVALEPESGASYHYRSVCYGLLGNDTEEHRDAVMARTLGFNAVVERAREQPQRIQSLNQSQGEMRRGIG